MKTSYLRTKCFCLLLSAHHLSSVSAHAGLFYPADNEMLKHYGRQLGMTIVDNPIGAVYVGPQSGKTSISESDYGDVVAEGYGWKAYRLDEQYVSTEAIIGFLKFLGNLTSEAASALWQEISNKGDIYAVWMDVYCRGKSCVLFRMPYGLIIVDSSQGGSPYVYYHQIPVTWESLASVLHIDDRTTFIQEMYNPEEISIKSHRELVSQWIPDYRNKAFENDKDLRGYLPKKTFKPHVRGR